MELPHGRSVLIRLFTYNEVSGSVPRSGNKQSGVSGGERPVTGQGRDTTYSVTVSW